MKIILCRGPLSTLDFSINQNVSIFSESTMFVTEIKVTVKGAPHDFPVLNIFIGNDLGESVRVRIYQRKWKDVFPPVRRPFCRHWLLAPRNSRAILASVYGSDFEITCKIKVLTLFNYQYLIFERFINLMT